MKNAHRVLIACCLLLASFRVCAGSFITMPEIGAGKMSISNAYTFSDSAGRDSGAYSVGFIGGYKFRSSIILAATLSSTGTEHIWNFNTDDEYYLRERGLLLGYSFDINRNFRIVPMVGWSSWDLEVEEGRFLNPGPEERLDFSGSDVYGRVGFEFPVTQLFQIMVSAIYGDYEFGRYKAARAGFKFEF